MEFREIDRKQQNLIFQVFFQADNGKKGYLTRKELKLAVVEIFGYKPSKYEVNEMFEKEQNISSGLSRDVFNKLMRSKLLMQDEDGEIRQTFLAFDTKCRGFIGLEDAKNIFEVVAPFVKQFDLQRLFREVDRDGDGRVSYRDFEYMMKFTTE